MPKATSRDVFSERRNRLLRLLSGAPALLASGTARARNYAGNRYPFRAESHFLYFVGRHIEGAYLLFDAHPTLYLSPQDEGDALWHGPSPSLAEWEKTLGLEVRPSTTLARDLGGRRASVATLPPQDEVTAHCSSKVLGRTITARSGHALPPGGPDAELANAMIALRLEIDEGGLEQLELAADATHQAHVAGMRATLPLRDEAWVCSRMEAELSARGMATAYGSIVTVHGEVLHHHGHENRLAEGDLLLCDVGAETAEGWACDVTRTWPVSGRYSPTQRAIYEIVLASQEAAIHACRVGARYRDVHQVAARQLITGLCDLGIFAGEVDGLLARRAHTLFFPHGVGHLMGLDVHDMEDLGDRAGYAPGRERSALFGDGYLRLDRDLTSGMVVTIEPGFYQIEALLAHPEHAGRLGDDLRRDALARFHDVRGIRIEDDVLISPDGPRVLTAAIPKTVLEIEATMFAGRESTKA